jgi:hypothetical protein
LDGVDIEVDKNFDDVLCHLNNINERVAGNKLALPVHKFTIENT